MNFSQLLQDVIHDLFEVGTVTDINEVTAIWPVAAVVVFFYMIYISSVEVLDTCRNL